MHYQVLSILKTFYNPKNFPLIPPLLIDYKFVTDIKTKANIFNKFLPEHCTHLNNDSWFPTNQIFLTQSRLGSLAFSEDEIFNIIRAFSIHKAHGHDDISIRMIKICDKSMLKTFKSYISELDQVILLLRYMEKI